jgi:hypothetical protein
MRWAPGRGRGTRWRGSSRRWRPGGTLTRPRHGNCSAIAGTWGNGPVHHLPGKRRAARPAVAGLRLVCATHDAKVGDFGIADDAGFVDAFREARRNVIGCRLQSILAGKTFRPTLCDLTTFLRRVVFVGEAGLSGPASA